MIVGIDEVGRGSWAGPICVAAVAWPDDLMLKGLNDSKKVAAKKRAWLDRAIKESAIDIGIGWAAPGLVDTLGVTRALQHAARQALTAIKTEFETLIIDGNLQLVDDPRAILQIKADATVPAVMAASIVAKVARDAYMQALDAVYGNYQFSKHVGYGTALHHSLLQQFGPSVVHRFSYAPIRALVQ